MADAAQNLDVQIDDDTETVRVDPETGTIEIPQPDGGVVVQLDAARADPAQDDEDPFYANLVGKMGSELGIIANELHEAIEADDKSRQGTLILYERALSLLGTKLEDPKASVGDSSAGAEGMSVVTNPLLLEACLKGWANAQAELLPASGPVKIKDDGDETIDRDELAEAFERDMNHYFTVTASEYYPDTSNMLLWGTHLRGSGFKKVYRCPLRRRPVSESVDAKDLIVSDTMKDLRSCERITHQITMRPSVMKRMQLAGAYRDIDLAQPTSQPNQVDEKIGGIQGTTSRSTRPEDQPYTIWESQCELDLDQFASKEFKGEGIPLPYIVTMDKDSREILAIRRNWTKDDKEAQRDRMYVRYPFVPGPGFYGTGLLNILGNCSAAMTAAWRMALDAGMLANFPGGLISKDAIRQNTSQFRVGPTEFAPVETGGKPIAQVVMGMPYKDVTPGLLTLMDKIQAQANSAGAAAEINVGEGLKDVPVGTMLAQIEQATKIMAAAFKGMHTAQGEEIELIVELFREHPEDFWRLNRECPPDYWDEVKFRQAVQDCKLVPVSDPNVPSHIHRVAKAVGLVQLFGIPIFAGLMDAKEALRRVLRAMREDPNGLILPPAPQSAAPPDPKAIEASAKVITAQAKAAEATAKAQQIPQQTQIDAAKLQTARDVAAAGLEKEKIIHQSDMANAERKAAIDRGDQTLKAVKTAHDIAQDQHGRQMDQASHGLDVHQARHDATMDVAQHALETHQVLHPPKPAAPKKS